MLGIEDELEQLDRLVIAAEPWAQLYNEDPKTHAKLIKNEAELIRVLRRFYIDLGNRASTMINWSKYRAEVQAFNVDVIVNDSPVDNSKGEFVKITLDKIATATETGAQAGENIYKIPLGITKSDDTIQEIARTQVAQLVTQVSDTVKQDIRTAISKSIETGETVQEATGRIRDVISDPARAEMIARTESVNSYGQGLQQFGKESGAVGKEWQDVNADDECADNADAGPIPIDDAFPSGDDTPAAHPNCRCSIRLVYQNEVDENPDLLGKPPETPPETPTIDDKPPEPEDNSLLSQISLLDRLPDADTGFKGEFNPKGDPAMSELTKRLGLNAKPEIYTAAEGKAEIKAGGTEMFRGYRTDNAQKFKASYVKDANPRQGYGVYGSGTYMTSDENVGLLYADLDKDNLAHYVISHDAKGISYEDIKGQMSTEYKEINKIFNQQKLSLSNADDIKANIKTIYTDPGRYAAFKGYDYITYLGSNNVQEMSVINRGIVGVMP